jgi:hypothetical protein
VKPTNADRRLKSKLGSFKIESISTPPDVLKDSFLP